MPPIYTRQWRPLSLRETGGLDGLSIRGGRELADAMNNYERHVSAFKVRSERFVEPVESLLGTANEVALLPLLVPPVPTGFNYFIWTIRHYRTAGAGDVEWRLRSIPFFYGRAAEPYDDTISGFSGSVVTSSDVPAYSHGETKIARADFKNDTHLVLTAEATDTYTVAEITNLDITWRRL